MADENEVNSEDIMRIMVSTDNHLGYAEKDPIRGEDSFIAFEEMLCLAVQENVDFILLGGDLFHDAVPSQNTLNRCMTLLRRYTFGEKEISLRILSDQTLNFHNTVNESVNYEDPNLNISIPVFSIHGNHDDPSGFGRLSSLDLLATTGLVNYFGRWKDLTKVDINPVLIQKGVTQLALYGLSHIHDGRLQRLFSNHKVQIAGPEENTGDWFHLMVLHQNRADRGLKNYIETKLLPSFLHLVIWGHEHDCRIEPEHCPIQDFYVSQPGSSVATSLAEGESLPKYVGILEIHKTKFQMKPLLLKTVRPFVFESVNLREMEEELALADGDASNKVRAMAEERIRAMIERAQSKLSGHEDQPVLPLIRLRICFYDESQMFNTMRFGQMYNKEVANPTDIIHFKKIVKKHIKDENDSNSFNTQEIRSALNKMEIDTCTRVEDFVDKYFEKVSEGKTLQVMSSKILTEMCYRLVERRDTNASENIVKYYKDQVVNHLMETKPEKDVLLQEMSNCKSKIQHDDVLKMLDERGNKSFAKAKANLSSSSFENDNQPSLATTSVTATRGRRRATTTTTTTTTSKKVNDIDEIEVVNLTNEKKTPTRGRASATNTRSTRSKPAAQLDVSINKTRTSPRKKSLFDVINSRSKAAVAAKPKKLATYVVSSDDSD